MDWRWNEPLESLPPSTPRKAARRACSRPAAPVRWTKRSFDELLQETDPVVGVTDIVGMPPLLPEAPATPLRRLAVAAASPPGAPMKACVSPLDALLCEDSANACEGRAVMDWRWNELLESLPLSTPRKTARQAWSPR